MTQTCGSFPVSTLTLKATLLTLRDTGGGLGQRTDYAIASFPSATPSAGIRRRPADRRRRRASAS